RIEHFDLDPFAWSRRQGPAAPHPALATQPPPSTGAMADGAGPRRGPGTVPPDEVGQGATSPHDDRPDNALPDAVGAPFPTAPPLSGIPLSGIPLPEAVRQLELSALRAALDRARHNRRVAAELLGISYDQFRGLYRRHRQDMEP
ncbi:helix-turn-helix domain-containing protein, partial [Nitratidesulfovibrio liaohensis]|uniref:helix-turn-helix domain-containing protein n=1 Tax=Nitratidesulfovibrio liaohensis TaxID=2604158 RepID=UPI00244397C7